MGSERAALEALRDAREAVERAGLCFSDLRRKRPIGCRSLREALDAIELARLEVVRFCEEQVPVLPSRRVSAG